VAGMLAAALLTSLPMEPLADDSGGASAGAEAFPTSIASSMAAQLLKHLPEDQRQKVFQEAGTSPSEADASGESASFSDRVGSIVTLMCIAIVFLWVRILWKEKRRYGTHNASMSGSFYAYLRYRFGSWYTWTSGAAAIVLLILSLTLLVLGGAMLRLLTGDSIAESFWVAWIWIAAPDGGGSAVTTYGRLIGVIVSCGGMLLFAMLMSVVSQNLEETLACFRQGSDPVIEGKHCVILGWSAIVPTLIHELCNANESQGGITIALLSPLGKIEVEEKLTASGINFLNSTVVVRSGDRTRHEDLAQVAVESAAIVVVLSKTGVSREDADARSSNTLLTMRTMGWPKEGVCVAQCQLTVNQRLFQRICHTKLEVVNTGNFVFGLLVQCSNQCGLASIVDSTFGFEGDEFYIAHVDGIAGRTVREVMFGLPQVVLLGIVPPGSPPQLLPPMDTTLLGTEQLILLAEDDSTLPSAFSDEVFNRSAIARAAAESAENNRCVETQVTSHGAQTIVICGWNEGIGAVMLELDKFVGAGSNVHIYSPVSAEERTKFLEDAQRRRKTRYKNFVVEHHVGPLNARLHLEDLPLERASKILILADSKAQTDAQADSHTVAVILQVQDILRIRIGTDINSVIVPQILEEATVHACHHMGITDFISSSKLSARILAMVSQSPAVSGILESLLSENGCKFCNRQLSDYSASSTFIEAAGTQGISFDEVAALAVRNNEIALGWSEVGGGAAGPWEMNPKDRTQRRPWPPEARIVSLRKASQDAAGAQGPVTGTAERGEKRQLPEPAEEEASPKRGCVDGGGLPDLVEE